jgi:Domain of unknown function (DUF1707)/2TM domain
VSTTVSGARESLAASVRASDAEREDTASRLRDHAAAGRLDLEELEDRLGAAFAARTRGELSTLLADLPRARARARAHAARRGGFRAHRNAYLLVAALLVGLWALSGGGYFWPVWPLLGWGIGLLSHGRACIAPRRRSASPG